MSKIVWYECKYCDSSSGPTDYEGDLVCRNCGAEWSPIRCEQDTAEFEREMHELDEELARYEEDLAYISQEDEEDEEEDLCMSFQPCDCECKGCPAYNQ